MDIGDYLHIYIYTWYVRPYLVAWECNVMNVMGYVMWEELSVSHFFSVVIIGSEH